jgi:hypothetical protein
LTCGKEVEKSKFPSGTLVPTMPTPLLDDRDLTTLRAKGDDADELFASFAAWAEEARTPLLLADG